jgi:hypothetical protein
MYKGDGGLGGRRWTSEERYLDGLAARVGHVRSMPPARNEEILLYWTGACVYFVWDGCTKAKRIIKPEWNIAILYKPSLV